MCVCMLHTNSVPTIKTNSTTCNISTSLTTLTGELGKDDELAVMYTEVAAHHGVRGAAAALAAAYHGTSEWAQVVGAGAIQEVEEGEEGVPTPRAARREGLAAALHWYDTALEPVTLGADVEEEASTLPGV